MKIRKEAVILGIVIVVLSLYLIFNKSDRSLYELPNLDPLPVSEISKISMDSPEGSILFLQKAGAWVINEAAYPGDETAIKRVVDIIADLKLTTLISESENYERYDLDPEHRITIKAWMGDKLVREFDVGKAASGHRHTFVKLAGDHRVYHAAESFRNRVQGKVDLFRYKTVLSFDTDHIEQIQITTADAQGDFLREKTLETSVQSSTEGETTQTEGGKPVWKNTAGEVVKDTKLTRMLKEFSSLKCSSFIYDRQKLDLKDPIATLAFKGAEDHTLQVFERLEKGASQYPAVSSQNDYAFYIPKWQADQVIKFFADMEAEEKQAAVKE